MLKRGKIKFSLAPEVESWCCQRVLLLQSQRHEQRQLIMIVELVSSLITTKKCEGKLKARYFEQPLQEHCPGARAQSLPSPPHEHFVFPPPTFFKSAFGHEEQAQCPSSHGHLLTFPPQLQTVLSLPGTLFTSLLAQLTHAQVPGLHGHEIELAPHLQVIFVPVAGVMPAACSAPPASFFLISARRRASACMS